MNQLGKWQGVRKSMGSASRKGVGVEVRRVYKVSVTQGDLPDCPPLS